MTITLHIRIQNTKPKTPNTKHTRKKSAFPTFYETVNVRIKYYLGIDINQCVR